MHRRLVTGGLAVLLTVAACSSADEPSEPWGSEAERYFAALSAAYLDNDFYGILDFYMASADVEKWRGAVRGGLPIQDLLRWNSGDLSQELEAVYLGGTGALTLVLWPRVADQGAVVSSVERGRIAHETVFELAASLGRSLRASPDVIATYEGLYDAYAEAWSGADAEHRARLYAPGASIEDALSGVAVSGRDAVVALDSPGGWEPVRNTAHSGRDGSAEGPSVYLGPRDYAQDPQRAVGVYEVMDADGCARRVAVHWVLDDGLIVTEHRYWHVETLRRCAAERLPDGWWSKLELPEPSDEVVTGVLRTVAGQDLAIRNGTERLEEFLEYGLERFAAAGLDEPVLDTITFEPSRSCVERTGRVLDDGSSRDLFLCLYESDLCPGSDSCTEPTLSVRIDILHELGHVWILDHVGERQQRELLELTGRPAWSDLDVPWPERGAEYSAEVIAWGLLDRSLPMVRIAAPPCEELWAAYQLLTGIAPLRDPAECPGLG